MQSSNTRNLAAECENQHSACYWCAPSWGIWCVTFPLVSASILQSEADHIIFQICPRSKHTTIFKQQRTNLCFLQIVFNANQVFMAQDGDAHQAMTCEETQPQKVNEMNWLMRGSRFLAKGRLSIPCSRIPPPHTLWYDANVARSPTLNSVCLQSADGYHRLPYLPNERIQTEYMSCHLFI